MENFANRIRSGNAAFEMAVAETDRSWRCGALAALGAASVPFILPALAAYACPACYGLERVTSTLYVEAAMPAQDRAKLQDTIVAAEARVAGFYGSFEGHPTLLACMTEACDRKLGGARRAAPPPTRHSAEASSAPPRAA